MPNINNSRPVKAKAPKKTQKPLYKVVHGSTPKELENQVSELLKQGYKLRGNLVTGLYDKTLCQTMTKGIR